MEGVMVIEEKIRTNISKVLNIVLMETIYLLVVILNMFAYTN